MGNIIFTNSFKEHQSEIAKLFVSVFTISDGEDEGKLIGALVSDLLAMTGEDKPFYFAALNEQELIASIIFSKLRFENSAISAYLLSPVAVKTEYQGQGIGQSLIQYGIQQLLNFQITLLFTYGDPKFYSKCGFQPIKESQIKAPLPLSYPHGWLCQSLVKQNIPKIDGNSKCVEPLDHPALW